MAFTTIRGATGTDTIKFEGTAAVDALFALNETAPMSVTGLGGNDIINLANSTGVVGNATVRGGEGNDTIRFTDAAGANVSRLSTSSVSGGQGDDDIFSEGAESTKIRGNEADDDFVLAGNYSNSTLNGNSGEDSFVVAAGVNNTGTITLSNSKIVGGGDNDGRMNFSTGNGIANAVDSRINGSKGNDQITIGTVALATKFNVSGGQGNDLITSSNAGADGIIYNGNDGDDQITTGAAKESVGGGAGNDLINAGGDNDSIDAGAGNDIVNDAAGNDISILGEGNDTYTDAAGSDTITGGAGADTYNVGPDSDENNNYVINAGDSAATLSGATQGFDTFDGGFFDASVDHIDITSVAESLLGDAVTGGTVVRTTQATVSGGDIAAGTTLNVVQLDDVTEVIGGVVTDVTGVAQNSVVAGLNTTTTYFNQRNGDTIATSTFVTATGVAAGAGNVVDAAYTGFAFTAAANDGAASANVTTIETSEILTSTASTFAALRSQFANGLTLTASGGPGNNFIDYNVVTVNNNAAGGIDGTYIIVNNTNNILDSGDVMFNVTNDADEINQFGIFSTTENASAWII